MSNQSLIRIQKDLLEIQRGSDLSIAAAPRESDIRYVRAIIIGPPETPYEFGFFEFNIKFPKEYPTKPPSVTAITTNGGRTRFNPNIYAQGKVCLSILGTWRGERGEQWSSAQGLESVLLSIQSLLSSNPYENEPGFEHAHSPGDKKVQQMYCQKIRHETLRISVIERLEDYFGMSRSWKNRPLAAYDADEDVRELNGSSAFDSPFDPFQDLCKRRFLWYYDSYMHAIEQESALNKDETPFATMPFEGGSNSMLGKFTWKVLATRMTAIKARLEEEVIKWETEGAQMFKDERTVAVNLARQFTQTKEIYQKSDTAVGLQMDLHDGNPFVWQLVLLGRPMTNLDGGIFRIKLYISPRFPNEEPRVKVETPLFHHRVSKDGNLCYLLPSSKKEDLKAHVEAIVQAIEDDSPAYDPRTTVNPEASKLLWGNEQDKKLYGRKLRRSAADSSEYVEPLAQLMTAANITVR